MFYVSVIGGANWVDDDAFLVTGAAPTSTLAWAPSADTGFIVGGAIGASLGQYMKGLRVEAEVAYRQNEVGGLWTSSTGAGNLDYDHSSLSVMANVWYDIPLGGGFSPYVGGGIGWADAEADGRYNVTTLGVTTTTVPFSFSDDGFAWQLGIGLNYQAAPNIQVGIGYRYFEGPEIPVTPAFALNTALGELDNQNHSAILHVTFGL
jgi:opacity protein-like surface antigen